MNKNRIWLFAGLGILTTCISILATKKYKSSRKKRSGLNRYKADADFPRYTDRIK